MTTFASDEMNLSLYTGVGSHHLEWVNFYVPGLYYDEERIIITHKVFAYLSWLGCKWIFQRTWW